MKNRTPYLEMWIHYKQGDDLSHHLERSPNPVQALRDWADVLASGAEGIREVAAALEGHKVEIDADTHHIGISVEDQTLVDKLLTINCITKSPFEDEELEDDYIEETDGTDYGDVIEFDDRE